MSLDCCVGGRTCSQSVFQEQKTLPHLQWNDSWGDNKPYASNPCAQPSPFPYTFTNFDAHYLKLAIKTKDALPNRPPLSDFRVFAIITYIDGVDGKLKHVEGSNVEIQFMGQSICAERSAYTVLRRVPFDKVVKLFVVSDASDIITPGLLCREFSLEFLDLDTPIVMGSAASNADGFVYRVSSLRHLWPHPPIYLRVHGANIPEFAAQFVKKATKFVDSPFAKQPGWTELYNATVAFTSKDRRTDLFCLQWAAGALMSDGTTELTVVSKLLEYGHTLDPVTKLVPLLERHAAKGVRPVVLMMCDQWGVLHPFTAPARAHMFESSLSPLYPGGLLRNCAILVHNYEGAIVQTSIEELVPDSPLLDEFFDSAEHKEQAESTHDATTVVKATGGASVPAVVVPRATVSLYSCSCVAYKAKPKA